MKTIGIVQQKEGVGRPKKEKSEPTEHFNIHTPESLAGDMRVYKARTRINIQDIMIQYRLCRIT